MKNWLLFMMTLLLLSACEQTTNSYYVFRGESANWEAQFKYNSSETWDDKNGKKSYDIDSQYELAIIYKGTVQELASLKKLQYSYETIVGGGETTMTFSQPTESRVFRDAGNGNGGKLSEDNVIKVTVKWDGHEETLELTTKN